MAKRTIKYGLPYCAMAILHDFVNLCGVSQWIVQDRARPHAVRKILRSFVSETLAFWCFFAIFWVIMIFHCCGRTRTSSLM